MSWPSARATSLPCKGVTATYWEEVVSGMRTYVPPRPGTGIPLPERVNRVGFDAAEQALLLSMFRISDGK